MKLLRLSRLNFCLRRRPRRWYRIFALRTAGNFLILGAVWALFLTFWPALEAEGGYKIRQFQDNLALRRQPPLIKVGRKTAPVQAVIKELPKTAVIFPTPTPAPRELVYPLDSEYGIVIPKIGANAALIPEVDPGNEKEYLVALKKGVAQAKGTCPPGTSNCNTFLFAHSVGNFWEVGRWNAVFYLLKELEAGDKVYLFWGGKRYDYEVYDKKIVEASETGYLSSQANFPLLTLQTCWPPGTTLKRLLVFARLRE